MEQLTPMDSTFLYLETANSPMHIGGLAIYDQSTTEEGTLRFKTIIETTRQRLPLARTFRQKLVKVPLSLDHPYWVEDKDFDIEFHIRHIALPAPGDWRQLCIQTARLHARPMDLNRPLWEMYVIEGLENVDGVPPGAFAILTKIHHAAIDGVSGSEILAAIHDLEPYPSNVELSDNWKGEREPGYGELLFRTAVNNLKQPFRMAKVLASTIRPIAKARAAMQRNELEGAGEVPRTRFNRPVSPHRVFDGKRFSLAEIREIKNKVPGATINDVVLTMCGGAARKYLSAKDELPEESLIAMAPISVRGNDESGAMGNQVSAMFVAIRSDIADPKERLIEVHRGTGNSKALTNALGARTMTDYQQFIPSTIAGLAARLYTRFGVANMMNPLFNMVITNVPGPQFPLYAYGSKLIGNWGLGPITDGMGLIMPCFSYNGEIIISFSSCRKIMPDPEFYAQCLTDAYDELYAAVVGAPKKRKPAKKASPAKKPPLAKKAPLAKSKKAAAPKVRRKVAKKAPQKAPATPEIQAAD